MRLAFWFIISPLYIMLVDEPPFSVREGGIIRDGCNEEVNRLREGMIIREDVFSKTGAVIVPDGAVVTKDVVALLTRHFVDSVMVEYPTGRKERPEQQEQSAPAKEQHLKEFQAEFSVAEQSISEELKDIV